jgi:hypothetical protein
MTHVVRGHGLSTGWGCDETVGVTSDAATVVYAAVRGLSNFVGQGLDETDEWSP